MITVQHLTVYQGVLGQDDELLVCAGRVAWWPLELMRYCVTKMSCLGMQGTITNSSTSTRTIKPTLLACVPGSPKGRHGAECMMPKEPSALRPLVLTSQGVS